MSRRISTDDAARRAEFVWLGPENFPWPFYARGSSWVLGMMLCPAAVVLTFFLLPISALVPGAAGLLLQGFLAVVIGTGLGVLTVRYIGRWTTPVTPLSHHGVVALAEIRAPKERTPVTRTTCVPASTWIEHDASGQTTRSTTLRAWLHTETL